MELNNVISFIAEFLSDFYFLDVYGDDVLQKVLRSHRKKMMVNKPWFCVVDEQ